MLEKMNKTVMHSYPGMVALVTTKSNGKQNIMSAGWHSYISYKPAIYGVSIAKERFSHKLIKESNEFAINFVPAEYAHYIQHCGMTSGKDIDKFAQLDIKYKAGISVSAPILTEAYVAYECQVMNIYPLGDHDWFVGSITQFYKDESKFMANGLPNFELLSIPLYLGRSKYQISNNNSEMIDLHKNKA